MRRSVLLTTIDRALQDLGACSAGQTLVVGLSGGADSVALLDALATLGARNSFRVVAAHLDHSLRPDSADDAAFCAEVCRRVGVSLVTGKADVRSRAQRDRSGIEEAARRERYSFLRSVKDAHGAVAVAVAHTRDDQAETFLLRLLRGAGSRGLSGMRPRSADILRPMLGVSRADVLNHLRSRDLPWREDPTNRDLGFLRNRVRHELIPYLEARFNPAIRGVLTRSAALLADEADTLVDLGRSLTDHAARRDGEAVILSASALRSARPAVAREAVRCAFQQVGGLRAVSALHVQRILDLARSTSPSGRRLGIPGGREAVFSFDEVRIGPRRGPATPFVYPLSVPGRVALPGDREIVARSADEPAVSKDESVVVAAPEGGEPLVVRTRRPGDRVSRKGREVSLRRFLMDVRVPADLRGRLPLVTSGHQVLWIPGLPVERARPAGGRYVRLELSGGGWSE